MPPDADEAPGGGDPPTIRRFALLALGWLCVGAGVIGIAVPGWPTTIFLLAALWAFSRSSRRFHDWLYTHPRFGPPLRDWREHGAISASAKRLAVLFMAAGLVVAAAVSDGWIFPAALGAVLAPVAVFIVTRPDRRAT